MICYKCLSKMIEIDLYRGSRHYKAAVCNDCGRFVTKYGTKRVWSGQA